MVQNTFINLETQNVAQARAFFTHVGLSINEKYSDDHGICVVINDNTFMMIMTHDRFKAFTLADTPNSFHQTEVIITLQLEDKLSVDSFISKVKEAKGSEFGYPTDNEFMYYRAFRDLDGHHFEVFFFKPLP